MQAVLEQTAFICRQSMLPTRVLSSSGQKRPGSWIYGAGRAREAFAEVICAIAESEQAYVLAEADVIDNARSVVEAVRKQKNYQENFPVKYIQMESDDAWARDVGPTS